MNFSDLAKMKDMMGQAKQMQEQMERKLSETVVEASTGGGIVTARMNGKKELLKLKIDPTVLGSSSSDIESSKTSLPPPSTSAAAAPKEAMKSSMAGMMGGLNIPRTHRLALRKT